MENSTAARRRLAAALALFGLPSHSAMAQTSAAYNCSWTGERGDTSWKFYGTYSGGERLSEARSWVKVTYAPRRTTSADGVEIQQPASVFACEDCSGLSSVKITLPTIASARFTAPPKVYLEYGDTSEPIGKMRLGSGKAGTASAVWEGNVNLGLVYKERIDQPFGVSVRSGDTVWTRSSFDGRDLNDLQERGRKKFDGKPVNTAGCSLSEEECFLTTATVGTVGLADDCWELRTLRAFRDKFLAASETGRALVDEYYATAPALVKKIDRRGDAGAVWLRTYWTGVLPSALCAAAGCNRIALALYARMTRRLEHLASA